MEQCPAYSEKKQKQKLLISKATQLNKIHPCTSEKEGGGARWGGGGGHTQHVMKAEEINKD